MMILFSLYEFIWFNQHTLILFSSGVHTFQKMYGCQWDDQDNVRNVRKEMRWISPVHQGFVTQNKWNNNRERKTLLQHCVHWVVEEVCGKEQPAENRYISNYAEVSMLHRHITLQPKTACPLKLSRAEACQPSMGNLLRKLFLEEVLVRPAGGAQPVSICVLTAQYNDRNTVL